jgi:hypothetical protein
MSEQVAQEAMILTKFVGRIDEVMEGEEEYFSDFDPVCADFEAT